MIWIMKNENFKDLAKRTAADKVLRAKAFNIAKDPKYDGYQHELGVPIFQSKNKRKGY